MRVRTSPRAFRATGTALGLVLALTTTVVGTATPPAGAATAKKTTATKKPAKKKATATTKKPAAKTTTTTTAPTTSTSTTTTVVASTTTTLLTPTSTIAAAAGPIAFTGCPGNPANVECATVQVPLDPKNPSAGQIGLFVSRRRATGPAPRIGALFLNPGGPGGPAFDLVKNAPLSLTPEVLARFDVVGVDPRGTDRSAALSCTTRGLPSSGNDTAERARTLFDAFARSCAGTDGDRLRFMDTETAARDLDAVRAALGEETISFLGYSYGTYLGAVYGALFPTRARALVLDSAVDPGRFGAQMLLDAIAGYEKDLDGFLDACASGALPRCPFNDGSDLRAKYLKVREDFVSTSRRGRASAEETFDATIAGLVGYPRNGWPVLGRALQELATGRPANFSLTAADNPSNDERERSAPSDVFSTATNVAINCRDGILPRDPAAYQYVYDQVPVQAPRFSGLRSAPAAVTCVNWAAPLASLVPLGPSAVPTMVVGNVYDPTTPFAWSQALASTIGATLLTRNGGGHGASDKSACVRETVARLLVDGAMPAPGTVCSPDIANPT